MEFENPYGEMPIKHVCMYVCMDGCMYGCMCVYVCPSCVAARDRGQVCQSVEDDGQRLK